jgi:hypothetical protein
MNSVTYFKVAGITPAAPFVLSHQFPHISNFSFDEGTHGAVTTRPPEAFTSFTYHQHSLPLIQTETHGNSHTAQILDTRKHGRIPPRDHREIMIPLPNPLSSSFSQGSRGRHDFPCLSFCPFMRMGADLDSGVETFL